MPAPWLLASSAKASVAPSASFVASGNGRSELVLDVVVLRHEVMVLRRQTAFQPTDGSIHSGLWQPPRIGPCEKSAQFADPVLTSTGLFVAGGRVVAGGRAVAEAIAKMIPVVGDLP